MIAAATYVHAQMVFSTVGPVTNARPYSGVIPTIAAPVAFLPPMSLTRSTYDRRSALYTQHHWEVKSFQCVDAFQSTNPEAAIRYRRDSVAGA